MLYESLTKTESVVKAARKSGLDMSVEYPDSENSVGYKLQDELRLSTRSLNGFYISPFCHDQEISDRVLNALKQVRDLFGNHPFHHVMDGRLASIVQEAIKNNLEIPDNFLDYKDFVIKPWNTPSLNYNTPRDIAIAVKGGYHPPEDLVDIPPDWILSL